MNADEQCQYASLTRTTHAPCTPPYSPRFSRTDEGAFGLYDGLSVSALHSVLEKFGYFYAYATLLAWYERRLRPRGLSMTPLASLLIA
jgi:hypothetical protein